MRLLSEVDIPNTPPNERLVEWAAESPPPPEWFEGEEEELFTRCTGS